ncbi:hypothetical protein [Streptomyces sp. MK5]|uniref:hypothetical protein n=1 Tax=Streptomyces sp. MK5 TaxID=3064253 RepID=UPI002741976B|nr:hypothetical protein [Streptomyces sp. MK5]
MRAWSELMEERGTSQDTPMKPQKKDQVQKLASALREGTPNRNRIALQMVRDVLDESSFDAGPGHVVPDKIAQAVSGIAHRLRDKADPRTSPVPRSDRQSRLGPEPAPLHADVADRTGPSPGRTPTADGPPGQRRSAEQKCQFPHVFGLKSGGGHGAGVCAGGGATP